MTCRFMSVIYIFSSSREDARYGREFFDEFTRLVYSDFTEFRRTHSLLHLCFFFLLSIVRISIETHANPEGFAALSGRTRKGTRSLRSLLFFFIFFCFFFCNSMLSVRYTGLTTPVEFDVSLCQS